MTEEYGERFGPLTLKALNSQGTAPILALIEQFRPDADGGNDMAASRINELKYRLADRYQKGSEGVAKDYSAAIALYEELLADGWGYSVAVELAGMYAIGQGVPVDYGKALALINEHASEGWDPYRNMFEPVVSCGGTTTLFQQPLKCAHRHYFTEGLAEAGLSPIRTDSDYRSDIWDSSDHMPGSSMLVAAFTDEHRLATVRYTFDGPLDAERAIRVQQMVAKKYGTPASSEGNEGVGPLTYRWQLPDGVELNVYREWPSTTTYLYYLMPGDHEKWVQQAKQDVEIEVPDKAL